MGPLVVALAYHLHHLELAADSAGEACADNFAVARAFGADLAACKE